ncbi:hypothetical protein CN157_05135 [Sinorhizobium meliloti]|uniref:hypothetical protein n=1 Tax=Rhizobium meliloti TaxID=382 RepID=UPI000FDA0133|nr:hypothetical protein [Sinorhizobium meliloti]RVK81404.1 hypothetical protein CN157_05135 [Sinorhizobium meliloti]RVQ78026.1 hypothetical protein CN061_07040 [Sinorhizobium meliloti]
MNDPFYIYRPMLDLLGKSEGTDKARGYNETLGYGAYTGGDRNLVGMTLEEIDRLQTQMLAHPKNRFNSSALGRYQIVRATLRKLKAALDLPGGMLFNGALQDRLGCYLMRGRGIDVWLAREMTDAALMDALAKEWASLPTSAGVGHYDGQRASVTTLEVRRALQEVRRRHEESRNRKEPASSEGGFVAVLLRLLKAVFGAKA